MLRQTHHIWRKVHITKTIHLQRCSPALFRTFQTDSTSGPPTGCAPGIVAGLLGIGAVGGYYWLKSDKESVSNTEKAAVGKEVAKSGAIRPAVEPASGEPPLPIYTLNQVREHDNVAAGIWVTSGPYVYNVTDYVEQHPGGNKILLAAGKQLEPFWGLYAVHKQPFVQKILKTFLIGVLSADDYAELTAKHSKSDAYANDPERPPIFKVNSETPFNAEPLAELAADTFITPNETFFVRNHLPVPKVNVENHKLSVNVGAGDFSFSVDDLKRKFVEKEVAVAIMCAGNRRSEMSAYKSVHGLSWSNHAIGNANWTGVPLRDVLLACGLSENSDPKLHVHFEGLDRGPEGATYGASVPLRTALDPNKELILAYKMNGEDIPLDHGFPLRVIIPGHVGARHVKWLQSIAIDSAESPSFWQQRDYKMFSPSTTQQSADFSTAAAIQEAPVQSAICEPREAGSVDQEDETVTVRGYAWSGGGRAITRVDVSGDGGTTWVPATLDQADQDVNAMWAWTLWEADVPISVAKGQQMEVICKATDISHNSQPESVAGIWNFRGLLNNSWHRIKLNVV